MRKSETLKLAGDTVRWIAFGAVVGALCGLASALFLWLLDAATRTQQDHSRLLFGLPLAGALIGLAYDRLGPDVSGGANLLLERIHEDGARVPFRMAPMILLATVTTHLFGGSAGREGTAVQMGGTIADLLAHPLRLLHAERRLLLMAGIAGGFGSVFGTPVAGAVFGVEVLAWGRIETRALAPCLVASLVGDWVCRGVGIRHHAYDAPSRFVLTPETLAWTLLATLAFAAAAAAFVELTHRIGRVGKGAPAWSRPWLVAWSSSP